MLASRTAARAQRVIRPQNVKVRYNVRYQSQTANATPSSPGASGAIAGGLAGGSAALLAVYGWYHFSGTKSAVQTAKMGKSYVDSATNSLKVQFEDKTPDTDTALKTLKDAANKYAAFIPGASQYVDSAFKDLETIRKKHGSEVDDVVSQAYGELRDASKHGMTMETAGEVYSILVKHAEQLFALGKDAAEDLMSNHPELKEKLGGSVDQLRQLGDKLGPEAKKEVDDTWKQVNELMQQGATLDTLNKAQQLMREKTKKLKEMSEQAFNPK